jgi:predicted GNAT family N-acyltransferase
VICQDAAARGERLSQRALARQLRQHGHRFPNQHLRLIATSIGLAHGNAA